MTNYEKHKEKIDKVLHDDTYMIAIDTNEKEVVTCRELNCKNCLFSHHYNKNTRCEVNRIKWLVAEYVEPVETEVDWSKVPVDTPVLVSNDKKFWFNRYFAGVDDDGRLFIFQNGRTSWSNKGYDRMVMPYKYIKLAEVSRNE